MSKVSTQENAVNFLRNKPEIKPEIIGENTAPKKLGKKKGLFLCFFIIGLILIMGGVAIHNFNEANRTNPDSFANKLMPKKLGFFKSVKNFLFSPDDVMSGQENDRINILLLGIGGAGHDGPYLSDTNIIASIKPSTQEVSLISIPRDLGAQIEDYGVYKINHADAFGENKNPGQGGDYARQVFEKTFNISIPYYIRVDFKTFEDIINAVDGITVDVKNPFTDQSYPGPNFSYQTISFTQGIQTMDGDTALKFARSRHGNNGENSDFSRSRRQQQILEAVKEKIMTFGTLANPVKLQKIWDSVAYNISTNLEAGQMLYLLDLVKDVSSQKIKNVVLDSSPDGYLYSFMSPTNGYLLAPKSGNFNEINDIIKNVFDPNFIPATPAAMPQVAYTDTVSTTLDTEKNNTESTTTPSAVIPVDSVLVEIKNGTWIGGLASRYQSKISDLGFTVLNIGNSEKRPLENTIIYLIDPAVPEESMNRLKTLFPSANIELGLPDWLQKNNTNTNASPTTEIADYNTQTDILIIIGTDAKD